MAIDSTSEVGLFQEFLVLRSSEQRLTGSLDEVVDEFRRYQSELSKLKSELAIGLEQCDRSEVKALDAGSIKEQLRQRLISKSTD